MQRVEDRKVFVGGLGRNTTNRKSARKRRSLFSAILRNSHLFLLSFTLFMLTESLRTYFGQFGAVEEVALPKNPEDGNGRGFGFTTFSEVSAANKALEAEEHVIDGKQA